MPPAEDDVFQLLQSWNDGEPRALEKLIPLVIDDLRAIARRYFAREDRDHTLQPTALVNEVFLRLRDRRSVDWHDPSHFFKFAARTMRRLLVDHARNRQAAKRGGEAVKVSLDDEMPFDPLAPDPAVLLALDEALDRLKERHERQCEVVELKFFVGLTILEIARTLDVRPTTVKSDWTAARAWLAYRLRSA